MKLYRINKYRGEEIVFENFCFEIPRIQRINIENIDEIASLTRNKYLNLLYSPI